MTVVVDASVVVAGLASADATGQWAEAVLAGAPLAAPHLMPAEAASILHRAELAGEISADTASLAHADLGRLRVEYFPYDPFAERIWELRSSGLASSGTGRPAETFYYSYQQQVEMLQRVRRGGADCDTSRRRVEFQMDALQKEINKRDTQARDALSQGREDLARAALQDKAKLGELRDQQQTLREQADRLSVAAQRLQAKIDAFRLRQETAVERSGHPGLTSYEAWYVALAEFLGAKLATLDTRLALVPGLRCGFCLPPPPPA